MWYQVPEGTLQKPAGFGSWVLHVSVLALFRLALFVLPAGLLGGRVPRSERSNAFRPGKKD